MNPSIIRQILRSDAIEYFCHVYGLEPSALKKQRLHSGAANLVYYVGANEPAYLRISYRKDRDPKMINSELSFLSYLSEQGFVCPRPLRSLQANISECYQVKGHILTAALFAELRGKHIYDMKFYLPKGVSLMQFYQECGRSLGLLHAHSHTFVATHEVNRFTWLDRHEQSLDWLFPEDPETATLLSQVISEIRSTPHGEMSYGLCHNDFNVGNYLIDYESTHFEMKLIDFDDCGWNYYMYDLACFWEMCTGWAINLAPVSEWADFMQRCYGTMLEEYHRHFTPDFDAQGLLPVFWKAVHLENILEPLRELSYAKKPILLDQESAYHLHCLKHNLGYLGLLDKCFSPQNPFCLA